MKSFLLSRIRSFGYAFRGWWHVLRTQQNAWIHAVISTAAIGVGLLILGPPLWEKISIWFGK
jgi:diacylglycerol kinase